MYMPTWVPAGMGKGVGTSPSLPPGKIVKCFDALVMTVKCLVDELLVHYFQNIPRFLGTSRLDPI